VTVTETTTQDFAHKVGAQVSLPGLQSTISSPPFPSSFMPQESSIDLGDLTDKNVGQLKILNAAIFPVKYNDKFYTDLLLPGREDLTKLGM
jgi:hypothetical protein